MTEQAERWPVIAVPAWLTKLMARAPRAKYADIDVEIAARRGRLAARRACQPSGWQGANRNGSCHRLRPTGAAGRHGTLAARLNLGV